MGWNKQTHIALVQNPVPLASASLTIVFSIKSLVITPRKLMVNCLTHMLGPYLDTLFFLLVNGTQFWGTAYSWINFLVSILHNARPSSRYIHPMGKSRGFESLAQKTTKGGRKFESPTVMTACGIYPHISCIYKLYKYTHKALYIDM